MRAKGFNPYTKHIILKHGIEGGNVSLTCELFGISRTSYYNWLDKYEKDGVLGLKEKTRKKPKMPNKVSKEVEREILNYVKKYPEDGPKRIYYELKSEGFKVGETGIYNVLKRNQLNTSKDRIKYSKGKLAQDPSKKLRDIKIIDSFKEATYPGATTIHRLEFIGRMENLGMVYQYVFYDIYSNWVEVKVFNRKSEIDIWNTLEVRLGYLMKIFNIRVKNMLGVKDREFLSCFLDEDKYENFLEDYGINHHFISPEDEDLLKGLRDFNEIIINNFYRDSKIQELKTFKELESALSSFVRDYNFSHAIESGDNKGKTPAELVLEESVKNGTDLDTLPIWLLALVNIPKKGDYND